MRQHPEYEQLITAESGILVAVQTIRKSFGRKYSLPLYRHPIRIDFGTTNDRVYIVHSCNFIEYEAKKMQSPENDRFSGLSIQISSQSFSEMALQHLEDRRLWIEELSAEHRIRDNAFVPISLQSTFTNAEH